MTNPMIQRYWKATESCALFHLEDWWIISVSGSDASDFLQRLGTGDIRKLTPGQGIQTLFLGGDGRIVADCYVVGEESGGFLLVAAASCGEQLLAQLDRFLFSEVVTLRRLPEDTYIGLVTGISQNELLKRLAAVKPSVITAQLPLSEEVRRGLVIVEPATFIEIRSEIYDQVDQLGGVIGDSDLYETIRIEAGLAEFGKDTNGKTIPLEAGLKTAISFTKGCFPGQEIVARINNLGHPANVLVGLKIPETSNSLVGKTLSVEGKTVGKITSVCFSPPIGSALALGYTKWNYREPGQILSIESEETLSVEVIQLPVGTTA